MSRALVFMGSHPADAHPASPSPADRAALGMAVELIGPSVTVYCASTNEQWWRYALAAGAGQIRPWTHESAPAQINEPFDAAFFASPLGTTGDGPAAELAEAQQCAMVLDVLELDYDAGDFTAVCDLGRGAKRIVATTSPAVFCISAEAPRPRYVSRYRRQRADTSAFTRPTRQTAAVTQSSQDIWRPVRPRVHAAKVDTATNMSASDRMHHAFGLSGDEQSQVADHVIRGDAATCADHLLRYLAHHSFIAGDVATSLPSAPKPVTSSIAAKSQPAVPASDQIDRPPLRRALRPLQGSTTGQSRRPRPVKLPTAPVAAVTGKLTRRPRPVGQAEPSQPRGPFAVDDAMVVKKVTL